MDLLKGAFSAVQDRLRNFGPQARPYEVQETNISQLSRIPVIVRQDCLTLYKDGEIFICTLYCPNVSPKAYSLFRLRSHDEAMSAYTNYCLKLPPLYLSSVHFVQKEVLQACVDLLCKNVTWGSAHLAAQLQLVDCFRHNLITQHLNDADEVTQVTPMMIAIQSGNREIIQELLICGVRLNMADQHGNNVFHYAAQSCNGEVVQFLASKDKSAINQLNLYGESAVHAACLEDKPEIVEFLIRWGADPTLTMSNRYPIHCAMYKNSLRCAEVLIGWSREQLCLQDKTYGGYPLHWARSREAIYLLADKGAAMDVRNKDNETALHIMIKRCRTQPVVGLLVQGANAELVGSSGNNALHLAIQTESYEMVQTLIVFGADVNYMNENGDTPRHLASKLTGDKRAHIIYLLHRVGATRCLTGVTGCTDGCIFDCTFNGTPKTKEVHLPVHLKRAIDDAVTEHTMTSAMIRSHSATESSLMSSTSQQLISPAAATPGDRVLCLDGGGIRGLVLIQILQAIEKATGHNIKDLFDWVGGTSTGGILALGICSGKSVRYMLGLYFKLKDEVFQGSRPYDSEPLEMFLKKEFGENSRMTDIQHPKVLVTGVLGDRIPADLHMFRNYERPAIDHDVLQRNSDYELPPRPHDQYIWRAARSSGAAPTYFRAFGRFLDGGLMANNPTIDVLTEIHEYHMGLRATNRNHEIRPLHVVVSLGTGILPVTAVNACDVYRPDGILDVYNIYKTVVGAKNLGLLFVEAATQSEGRPVERAHAWCSMIGVPFFRFSPHLTDDIAIDCKDDAELINMLWQTQCYINDHWHRFKQLATVLCP